MELNRGGRLWLLDENGEVIEAAILHARIPFGLPEKTEYFVLHLKPNEEHTIEHLYKHGSTMVHGLKVIEKQQHHE